MASSNGAVEHDSVPSRSFQKLREEYGLFKTLTSYHEEISMVKSTDQEEQQLQPQSQPQSSTKQQTNSGLIT